MRRLRVLLDGKLSPDGHRLCLAAVVFRFTAAGGFDGADLPVFNVHTQVDALDGAERIRNRRRQQRKRLLCVAAVGGHGIDLFTAFTGVGHIGRVVEFQQMLAERGIVREQAARAVGAAVFEVDRAVIIIQLHAVILDAEDGVPTGLRAEQAHVRSQRLVAKLHLHGRGHVQFLPAGEVFQQQKRVHAALETGPVDEDPGGDQNHGQTRRFFFFFCSCSGETGASCASGSMTPMTASLAFCSSCMALRSACIWRRRFLPVLWIR